ncbi:hypothetical protein Pfo_012043 [Paulownia fortunei]|nr:hypothetical protein Pfo_012043 [Paulownia fortunei]
MGGHNLSFTLTPFLLSLFFVFLLHVPVRAQDDVCTNVDCARGTCVPNQGSILGFDCVCDSGWKKVQLGPLTFPTCTVPNCTLDFQCGNGAPPPPPSKLPPFNLLNPCNLVWCGDGTCVANVAGHYCQCNEGSANLFNLTALACFKQCSFGADCNGLGLGPHVPPPPNGSDEISKSWRSCDGFNMILLSAIILVSVL